MGCGEWGVRGGEWGVRGGVWGVECRRLYGEFRVETEEVSREKPKQAVGDRRAK